MTVEELIKQKAKTFSNSTYVVPEIPDKKLNNAIIGMTESTVSPEYVVAVTDTTLFGKSDDGFLFTGEAMYWHPGGTRHVIVKFAELQSAKVRIERVTDSKGKVKETELLCVKDKSGNVLIDDRIIMINQENLAKFLNEVVKLGASSESAFESTKQTLALCDCDESIKVAYVKVVVNLAFSDDGEIDGKEFASIYGLMVRNDFSDGARLAMRSYMFDGKNITPTDELLAELKEKVDHGSFEAIALSLVKDCIYLNYKKKEGTKLSDWRSCAFITDLVQKLDFSEEKVAIIVEAIKNDEDILSERKSDSELEKTMKDLAAKAAAVGAPLAAVYMSGSVLGFSAAGITSGLATLGFGFGMLGGVGFVVLGGVAAYKAVKYFTDADGVEVCKQRELLIKNIIQNNQKIINYFVKDINEISNKLFSAIEVANMDKELIAKLKKALAIVSKGSTATAGNILYGAKETVIAKLPQKLNREKFDKLTESPTKIKLRPFVYEIYPELKEKEIKDKEGKTHAEKAFWLDDQFEIKKYENALKCLQGANYLRAE